MLLLSLRAFTVFYSIYPSAKKNLNGSMLLFSLTGLTVFYGIFLCLLPTGVLSYTEMVV